MEQREEYIARIINRPAEHGFTEVKMVNAPQIQVSRWVRHRCWYLCQNAHGSDVTPPATPRSDETQEIVDEYKFGVICRKEIGFPFPADFDREWLDFQTAMIRAENEAFVRGYGKAFTIGVGNCLFGHHDDSLRPCKFEGKKRPTLESVGVNLYETLNMVGWDAYVVRDPHEPFQVFGLLLLE